MLFRWYLWRAPVPVVFAVAALRELFMVTARR
jgi:hypothetical protein